jgi:hypothetical protein
VKVLSLGGDARESRLGWRRSEAEGGEITWKRKMQFCVFRISIVMRGIVQQISSLKYSYSTVKLLGFATLGHLLKHADN